MPTLRTDGGWHLDETAKDRVGQAAIVLGCLLAHGLVGLWLVSDAAPESEPATTTPMEVFFIPASNSPEAVPAFPRAPQRPMSAQIRSQAPSPTSLPPDVASAARDSQTPSPPEVDSARLLDLGRMAARGAAGPLQLAPRNPMQHKTPALAGRAEPFTPRAIELYDPMTVRDALLLIGSLTGGNYDPCPDTRSKIADLTRRNDPRADAELQILLDRERRRCRR